MRKLSLIEVTLLLQIDAMHHGCTEPAQGLSWAIDQGYAEYLGGDEPMQTHQWTEAGLERAHEVYHEFRDVMERAKATLLLGNAT